MWALYETASNEIQLIEGTSAEDTTELLWITKAYTTEVTHTVQIWITKAYIVEVKTEVMVK